MNKLLIYSCVYLFGVVISAFSQIILKKSSQKEYANKIREYLNVRVITSYSIFFVATLCTVFAYKYVPLSMGPVLASTEYIFIAILSYLFLKEKVKGKKLVGLILIVGGIIIFSL